MLRILYLEIEGLEDKPELQVPDNEDFLPIVRINEDEESTNAIYSTKSCNTCKKQTIDLGEDFDEDKRNYVIAEIVIAKSSKSFIPLENIKGYGHWATMEDGDGVLEFKCSNSKVQFRLLKESTPKDCNDKTKLYDLKDAELGDTYTLEISHALDRGAKFSIEIWASDDNDLSSGSHSNKIVKCGKFNFTVLADKDIFLEDEKGKLIGENKISMNKHELCYVAVDKQFSKVVDNTSFVLNNYSGLSGYDRTKDYTAKGYVQSTQRFEQKTTWVRDSKLKPTSFKQGQENAFSNYIKQTVRNRIGYHIYYFILLNGYHVLTLLIDNTDCCDTKYKILDQLSDRNWEKLTGLDKDLLAMTIRNYDGACASAKRTDHDSSIQLWKLQRK